MRIKCLTSGNIVSHSEVVFEDIPHTRYGTDREQVRRIPPQFKVFGCILVAVLRKLCRFEGKGKFIFPGGTSYYVGEMKDGMSVAAFRTQDMPCYRFHGEGTIFFPDQGKYVAKWDNGRVVEV